MTNRWIQTDAQQTQRCWWCGTDSEYVRYHDREWGVPVKNEKKLFEKICLEGFQSGLSWLTILRKRPAFREAFADFDIGSVARFTKRRVDSLLKNAAIIRHRGKIEATINNAQLMDAMRKQHGSLARFLWQFEPSQSPHFDVKRTTSDESVSMSKQLKKLGWKFVGPTTCFSLMEAMGIMNNHHPECWRYSEIEQKRESFKRPA